MQKNCTADHRQYACTLYAAWAVYDDVKFDEHHLGADGADRIEFR